MSTDRQTRQLVVFSLGEEEYALPIQQVHEIIRFSEPRSVASRVDWVRGVISLRGKIVPVHDLAMRLGVAGRGSDESAKIVIVETEAAMAGVIVDDVEEVVTVDTEQLEAAPTSGGEAVEAIAKLGDRLVVLLDPAALFVADELAEA
jgi:purine-binding chemotaxis protein CheW